MTCTVVDAGPWDDEEFQDYYYKESGKRVPEGEMVGVDITNCDFTYFVILEELTTDY